MKGSGIAALVTVLAMAVGVTSASAAAPVAQAAKTTCKKSKRTGTKVCTVTGARGKTGARGPKGDKGEKGDTGASGGTGAKGDKGDKGDAGLPGATGATGPAGSGAATAYATLPGPLTTASTTYVPTGVAVDVIVPPSGNLLVAASTETADEAALTLMRDGVTNLGVLDCGANDELFDTPGVAGIWGTPGTLGFANCSSAGSPAAVYINTTPGAAHLELYYLSCACGGGSVSLTNPRLWVTPLP